MQRAELGPRSWLRVAGLGVSGLAFLLLATSGVLMAGVYGEGLGLSDRLGFIPLSAFAGVSAVILRKLPAHPVGWLLAGFALVFGVAGAADVVSRAASDPGITAVAGWLASWVWVLAFGTLGLAVLVFPDGRLPSRRWYPVLALVLAGLVGGIVLGATLWSYRSLDLVALGDAFPGRAGPVGQVVLPITMLSFVGAVASLVARARGGSRTVRLQLKWLLLAVALLAFALVAAAVRDRFGAGHPAVSDVAGILGLVAVPLAFGVAVTRHRLYDIDRILSRTLAYTLVVSGLGAVYAATIVVLTTVLEPLAGGSDLAVAGSTLAAAAAARPLHRRLRSVVDRRFDRAHYDAEVLIAGFAERSRRQVGADSLASDLLATAARAVQPSSVSLVVMGPEPG